MGIRSNCDWNESRNEFALGEESKTRVKLCSLFLILIFPSFVHENLKNSNYYKNKNYTFFINFEEKLKIWI